MYIYTGRCPDNGICTVHTTVNVIKLFFKRYYARSFKYIQSKHIQYARTCTGSCILKHFFKTLHFILNKNKKLYGCF